MSRTANSRRFLVTSLRKFAASPPIPARSSTAESAFSCSSAEKTGLRTSRVRSALSRNERVEAIKIGLHGVDGIGVAREIEQRGRVAAGHAGHKVFFACQVGPSMIGSSRIL